jgi:hypothetical protein
LNEVGQIKWSKKKNLVEEGLQKTKSIGSWMKYVGSRFFPRFVVTLWSLAKE